MTKSRTVVFYHYFEDDEAIRNLTYFLEVGHNQEADFFIIIADGCSIDLPTARNISYIETANRNYDFGGYAQAVNEVDLTHYEYFVFINSSVRGPFISSSVKGSWIDAFTNRLQGDVGICGSTINVLRPPSDHLFWMTGRMTPGGVAPHVQTYAYALRKDAFGFLTNCGFYKQPPSVWSKDATIANYEIELSLRLLGAGWNLDCLALKYSGIDYRTLCLDFNPTSYNGSPLVKGGYFGKNLDPFEIFFVKPKRNYVDLRVLN
ncbi:hypothetical protein [Lacimonas salitolerans]|uniref:Glycosyl transferase family 2 n=1 Tax=Lacimonas salitolerans TaxID=1323750 RepID=A0ABW4EIS0_9RHOB